MTWTAVADLPEGMMGPACCQFDGKLYAFGGDAGGQAAYVYDPAVDAWAALADMTSGAGFPSAAFDLGDGGIYVLPVQDANRMSRYDPVTDTYNNALPNPSGTATPSGSSACSDGAKIYYLEYPTDTEADTTGLPRISVFDPATGWSTTGTICPDTVAPNGVWTASAFIVDGVIWITGSSGAPAFDGVVVTYTIATDTWAAGPSTVPTPREGYAMTVTGVGLLPLIGGDDGDVTYYDLVDIYDPATDTWTTYDALPGAATVVGASLCGDYLYAVGGYVDPAGITSVVRAPAADFDPLDPLGGTVSVATTTAVPLQWSFETSATVAASTWAGDDDDRWQFPLEWSFVIDLEPPDDVEDP